MKIVPLKPQANATSTAEVVVANPMLPELDKLVNELVVLAAISGTAYRAMQAGDEKKLLRQLEGMQKMITACSAKTQMLLWNYQKPAAPRKRPVRMIAAA